MGCQNKNANNKNKKTVQPCQRHGQNAQARCNRRCANAQRQQKKAVEPPPTRIVVQRTPIHMDDSHQELAKMSLDVTGFAPHQIKVSVDEYVVSISGERRNKLGDLFVIDRKFRLDKKTALVDGVEASFDNDDVAGILEIVVPKNVSAGPRTIPIAVVTSSRSNNTTDEETEVVDDVVEETTTEDDDNQSDAATTPADHEEEEEEQNHSTEEVTSVETVQEEDADEEEVENDEQQTDATTDDDGGDVVVTEGLEWEEVASEEKE